MGDPLHEKLSRVLSLDGGGAKGFYTLGALKEIEGLTGRKLFENFDLVFGTSTGAIIAALVGLGYSVDDMLALYRKHVVKIMGRLLPYRKSAGLEQLSAEVFGDQRFDAFKVDMGIVCTRWNFERPMIFKTKPDQAFAGKGTFVPGFGCTIGDAVIGSCSAYPFFKKKIVTTSRGERVEVADGGYCANNPTLYALSDATGPLGVLRANVRVVSIGVGEYPAPRKSWLSAMRWLSYLPSVKTSAEIAGN
jgi:patatin-like phospholipase/acyl hydrolase